MLHLSRTKSRVLKVSGVCFVWFAVAWVASDLPPFDQDRHAATLEERFEPDQLLAKYVTEERLATFESNTGSAPALAVASNSQFWGLPAGIDEQTYQPVEVTVAMGDTLSAIFSNHNVAEDQWLGVYNNDHETRPLSEIHVGDQLHFIVNPDGAINSLVYRQVDPRETFKYIRTHNGWDIARKQPVREIRRFAKHVTINAGEVPESAGVRAGIKREAIAALERLLRWHIDFHHDIRPNDTFSIIYEDEYLDGQYEGLHRILGLSFTTYKGTFEILRFERENQFVGHYSPDGTTTKRNFLAAPVKYTRISSHFNKRRFHPIRKVTVAHNGTDYAAPRGAPVYATADGVVLKASFTGPNGNFVFLRHANGIETRYLHFTKIRSGIKPGVSVSQGEVIGFVGATGYATAPHVHYEFLENGKHQDPWKVNPPAAQPLNGEDLEEFKLATAPILAALSQLTKPEPAPQPIFAQQ